MNQSSIITALIAHVVSECNAVDTESAYRTMLDETLPEVEVGNLTFSPSRVIEELDPTAFRCGCADYSSGSDFVEINGDTYRADEVEDARQSFVNDKASEISDKETEIGELEASQESTEKAQDELSTLEAELKEIEDHAF